MILLPTLLCICIGLEVHAQNVGDFEDIESTTKKGFFKDYFKKHFQGLFSDFKNGSPLAISGGFGTNLRSYSAWGVDNRQDPFFYSFNASLNIQIYKLNIPFTALITARNQTSSLPNIRELLEAFKPDPSQYRNRFARIGASPYYKWIKLHVGHRGMNFSPMTMSNLNFFGVGTELTPGKVRVAGMYGRLAKAEPIDLSLVEPNFPIFQRMGYGMKLGYGDNQNFVDVIMFRAADDLNSIGFVPDSLQQVDAAENLVMGINLQKQVSDKISVKLEYASSAYSPDKEDPMEGAASFPHIGFDNRISTEYKTAYDAGINYQGSGFTLGLQVQRIDPGYRSLGTYFFNDDLLNYLANTSWSMLQNKLQISASGGLQENNLDGSKATRVRRIIGSLNANYTLEKLTLGLTYSNFTSDVAYLLNNTADSLNTIIVTQDAGINATYRLGGDGGNQQVITASINLQQVNDDIESRQASSDSRMLVANLTHSLAFQETGWRLSTRVNFNQNELQGITTRRWGAGLGISRSFLENKLTTGLEVNFFAVNTGQGATNSTLNSRLRANWKLGKSHGLNFSAGLINQSKRSSASEQQFSELTVTLGYNYRFSWDIKNRKKGKDEASNNE